ncbi:MAG: hypothetical protein Q8K79_22945 [Solirubrobacteraceae bacterium]|nr:hypothetical protein [Solirubrobacteraceae bacterium]
MPDASQGRLGRVLAGSRAGLGRVPAGTQARLAALLAAHGAERVSRVTILGLIVLMGTGTAAALAMLPSDARTAAARQGATAQSHRFAVGQLVAQTPRRAGPAYYAETAKRRVPASTGTGFLALYRAAARTFGVSWRLLASIHRQETAFSTAPTTYHGLNPFGCCAGPMQFNVTNGPPSTWALYRQSFRHGKRPKRYPHPTRHHPSIYDDFDAIMAAGALLRDSGATDALDGGSWSAAYAYYGHDLFGTEYASQVLARARGWERDGFCVNCPVDGALVAEYDDAYGVAARRQLLADERREKSEKRKKKRDQERRKKERAEARRNAAEQERADRREARRSVPSEPARRAPETPAEATPPPPPATTTTPPTTTTEPPPAPAPPPPPACTGLKKLLGCG